jgi:predicted transcriptional regulator
MYSTNIFCIIPEPRLLQVLLMLKVEGPVGRYRLKALLDLEENEGVVRRILELLSSKGLVKPTRSGCILTPLGELCMNELLKQRGIVDFSEVDLTKMKVGPKSIALHIRRPVPAKRSILDLRDEAVRMGAHGVLILAYKGTSLAIPSIKKSVANRYLPIFEGLKQRFSLVDGDNIIVVFADTRSRALSGSLAVAFALDN